MSPRSRHVLPIALLAVCAVYATLAVTASAKASKGGPLTGTWSGIIYSSGADGRSQEHMTITVNAAETAGSWKISAKCQGTLALESISGGYHHFKRRLSRTSTCTKHNVDCLKRSGVYLYDTVTPPSGGPWYEAGNLSRAKS